MRHSRVNKQTSLLSDVCATACGTLGGAVSGLRVLSTLPEKKKKKQPRRGGGVPRLVVSPVRSCVHSPSADKQQVVSDFISKMNGLDEETMAPQTFLYGEKHVLHVAWLVLTVFNVSPPRV